MEVLVRLQSFFGKTELSSQRVLLIHSGGLSQRTPQFSVLGKVFAPLPGGKTIFETKLDEYKRHLLPKLPAGLFICASDVVEDLAGCHFPDGPMDFVLLAHHSKLEVAQGHGVFVVDEANTLQTVLQKPTPAELLAYPGAKLKDDCYLTDSAYWINWDIGKKLTEEYAAKRPIQCELCCYSDFMRPLGKTPDLRYLDEAPGEKGSWQQFYASTFKGSRVGLMIQGTNTFFHFGTSNEYFQHCAPGSEFYKKFIKGSSTREHLEFYCSIDPKTVIGYGSILFDVVIESPVEVPEDILIFTLPVDDGYITALFPVSVDIKNTTSWGLHPLHSNSLWSAPLFPMRATRFESIRATLQLWNSDGHQDIPEKLYSISEAISACEVAKLVKHRLEFEGQ